MSTVRTRLERAFGASTTPAVGPPAAPSIRRLQVGISGLALAAATGFVMAFASADAAITRSFPADEQLLTGYGDLMAAAGEIPEGIDLVLGKPLTLHKLRQALNFTASGTTAPTRRLHPAPPTPGMLLA